MMSFFIKFYARRSNSSRNFKIEMDALRVVQYVATKATLRVSEGVYE
jgi:hypothetical protein